MWYAVFEKATGRLESVGSVLADPLPEGLEVKEFAERPDQDPTTSWDGLTKTFVTKILVPEI